MAIETRILTTHASLRAESQGDELVLRGYAARFNVLSHPLPQGFREKIQPGAFKRSLAAGDDVVCTFNHDESRVLGRRSSGTLKVAEDDKGLAFRCQLDKNQVAHRDLHASVKRGDISDCSFAFNVVGDDGEDFADSWLSGQNCLVRTLRNVKLHDVSVVTHPAYPQTSVDARAAVAAADKIITRHNKRENFTRAKQIAAEYPELSLETVARGLRLGYSEDVMLQLRFAEITKRQGFGFEPGVQSPRYQGGQSEDPEQTFRDSDGIHPEAARTQAEHEESAKYHLARAGKAHSLAEAEGHYHCADRHAYAAAHPNDTLASHRARDSSRIHRS
jgi:HK97 family phage prohead protease